MLQKLKQTAKHTVIYSFGNISTKLAGLILLPFYTKYISIDEYGIVGILETTTTLLIMVLGMNMHVSVMRWFSSVKTLDEQKKIVSSAFYPTLILVVAACIIFIQFSTHLSILFFGTETSSIFFKYQIISVILSIINSFSISLVRMEEKSVYFSTVSIITLVVTLSTNMYFVGILSLGVKGIILSQILGFAMQSVLYFPTLFKYLTLSISKKTMFEMLAYSAPLVLSALSSHLLNLGDRYIIPMFLSYSALGIYAVGYKISGVITTFFISSFQMGFLPLAFKMFDKPGAKEFFIKVLSYFTLILLFAALGLSLFSNELLLLLAPFNEKYRLGAVYIPFLSLLVVLKGMEYVILLGLHYTKKTKYSAVILLGGSILNILLNILLIQKFELYGVVVSSLISGMMVTYFYYRYSNRFYPVNYEWNRIAKLFVTAISLFLLSFTFADLNIYIRLVLKTILITSYPFLLYVIKFYSLKEIETIKTFIQTWKNPLKWKENLKLLLTKKATDEKSNKENDL